MTTVNGASRIRRPFRWSIRDFRDTAKTSRVATDRRHNPLQQSGWPRLKDFMWQPRWHSCLFKMSGQKMVKWPQICVWEYFSHCLIQAFNQQWVRGKAGKKPSLQTPSTYWDADLQDCQNVFCTHTHTHTKTHRDQLLGHKLPSGSLPWQARSMHPWLRTRTHTNL